MYAARVLYAAAFYVLLMVLVIVVRPRALFDSRTGRPRPFGTGPGRTVFPLGVITAVAAALSLYSFALVDLVAG